MLLDSGIESGSSPELRHHRIPHHHHQNGAVDPSSMSRTHQYRKVMKPLLERKRRARINKCLDELKDIMVVALQSEGESITKLEKADVLELTVRHMQKLKDHDALNLTPQATYAGKFKAGYTHCAQEVSRFMSTAAPAVDVHVSTRLLSHLGGCLQALDTLGPSTLAITASPLLVTPGHWPLLSQPRTPTAAVAASAFPPLMQPDSLSPSPGSRRSALSPSVLATYKQRDDPEGEEDDDKAWRPW